MKRRQFLKKTFSSSVMAGMAVGLSGYTVQTKNITKNKIDKTIKKVKMAMLSMQRMAWEQGVAAQSLLELGDTDQVIRMAKEAVVRQLKDGRLGVISANQGVTDPASNGEPVLFAAKVSGDAALYNGAKKMLEYLLYKAPRTGEGILYHITHKPQVWIDSVYMAPPFIAVAGRPDEAVKQIKGFRKLLWNKKKKLFSQIWDDGKKVFIREACWGVGNGWAAAGITRVIHALPKEMEKEKKRMVTFVTEIVDGCLIHLRPDGFFHDVVDDPKTFVETNLSQMLAYCIYRGVQRGWLNDSYTKYADRMRRAARTKVDKYGLVQDVCGSPEFNSPGTATEGQAFFLLMETAFRDRH